MRRLRTLWTMHALRKETTHVDDARAAERENVSWSAPVEVPRAQPSPVLAMRVGNHKVSRFTETTIMFRGHMY